MKLKQFLIGITIITMLGGCIPKRYEWSPDGKWMTVLSDAGLMIADADGKLLPTIIKEVGLATWLPDSKHVLACRKIEVSTWGELAPHLSVDQTKSIDQAALRVRQAMASFQFIPADNGKWDRFLTWLTDQEAAAGRDTAVYKEMAGAIGLYLRDHPDEAFRQKVPAPQWKDFESLTQSLFVVEVYTVDSSNLRLSQTLMTTTKQVREMRVDPRGRAAIVVTASDADHSCELNVVMADATHSVLNVSTTASWYPDWSPDGREIIFARTIDPQTSSRAALGSISRARVFDDSGNLMPKVAAIDDLAGAVYGEFTRVRCLKDGRIIFASVAVNLPATDGDMPEHLQLFAINPGKLPTVTRLLPAKSLDDIGNAAQYFEVSPDETRVSIPDTSGKVCVIELATGSVTEVQGKPIQSNGADHHDQGSLITIPAWRTSDELTFLSPGDSGHPAVTLWSITKNEGRNISSTWPVGLTDEKTSTTEPSTRETAPPPPLVAH
jgi:hypothetical protein